MSTQELTPQTKVTPLPKPKQEPKECMRTLHDPMWLAIQRLTKKEEQP